MVTKNRYCQQCYNNAVKYVFQINENEKENLVRTTKFKAFHQWYFARYILQPINGAHTMLHKTVFFFVYCVFYRFHSYQRLINQINIVCDTDLDITEIIWLKKNNDIINQCNVYNLTKFMICLGKLPKVFHIYFRKYLSILSIKQK